ncbi:MAG: hypothetical protein GVY30_09385 [Chloroflexi bacterium]|jgi:predicted small lipoprotein YifL|nr:hypothetical protein [Chloroflexota bacterium]
MKTKRWPLLLVVTLLTALIITGCGTPKPTEAPPAPTATEAPAAEPETESELEMETEEATPEETTEPEETEEATPEKESEPEETEAGWTADGVIAEGEYAQQADYNGIRVWWMNDDAHLYLAMEGDTTGWVAVGINPELGMKGADYIFGYVADGEAQVWDAWGQDRTGATHPPDTEIGGSDDIVAFAGVEEEGVTRLEVQIPLDSGDEYDHALVPGKSYPLIVAIGGKDEFNAYHSKYAPGELTISAP